MPIVFPDGMAFSQQYKLKLISTSPAIEYVFSDDGVEVDFSLGAPYIFTNNLTGLMVCVDFDATIMLETNSCFENENVFEAYIKAGDL